MKNLFEQHYLLQEGMYFADKDSTNNGVIYLSDLIKDFYWNMLVLKDDIKLDDKILNQIEIDFGKNKRSSCIYLFSNDFQYADNSKFLQQHGYASAGRETWQVYDGRSITINEEKELKLVRTQKDKEDFIDVFVSAYGGEKSLEQPYGALPNTYVDCLRRSMDDTKKNHHFIVYNNQFPASVATLCFEDGIGGLYNVGTKPAYRGRGFGLYVTQACIEQWKKLKGNSLFLQTEIGSKVENWYKSLAFTEVFVGEFYVKEEGA
jgi:N-acetylglutamate synthase and related acetyltransferases